MPSYPVQLEVPAPPRYDRMQLLVRLGIAIALGIIGIEGGWLWSVLFVSLPVIAAAVISSRGVDGYLTQTGPRLWTGLSWLLAFTAYMLLITDRISFDDQRARIDLHTTGRPTVGSALVRLITSIPSAFVLGLIGCVSCLLWLVALVTILFSARVPASIVEFQTGYLRWQARLLAYHASLVEEYPPFSFGDRASNLPTAMVNP
jgi:hypothetical protein